MNEPVIAGLRPWLPWPLYRFPWWIDPVPAQRLAALRIGTGVALLIDVLLNYLPWVGAFFGRGSLAPPEIFGAGQRPVMWPWSPFAALEDPLGWRIVMIVWAAAALGLAVGLFPRLCAALAWAIALSAGNINPYLLNAGDNVRTILLFYLMLTPCGAVWSLTGRRQADGPVLVWPWALRLLFIQMAVIYCMNGIHKLLGTQWRDGSALYYAVASLDWPRWPYAALPVPYWLTQLLTWLTIVWEIGFPALVIWRPTRVPTLCLGVLFHIGSGAMLLLGPFPLYMLCLYLPLVPWERYRDRAARGADQNTALTETGESLPK